jgi:hypothetical protein
MSKTTHPAATPVISGEVLLKNGLEAVQTGAGLLTSEASERDLRLALREVSSGVELVLKAILVSEHWSLIYDDPSKATLEDFKQGRLKSAGFEECLRRIEHIVGLTLTPKQTQHLTRMRDKRNRLEHLGLLDNILALRSAIGGSLHALVALIEQAGSDGLIASQNEQLHTELAIQLSAVDDFVKERWKEVTPSLPKNGADTCFACGKDAAVVEDGLRCVFCGTYVPAEAAANEYVTNVLGYSHYDVVKDGGEWPVHDCPECGTTALVVIQQDDEKYRCFSCDTRYGPRELIRCVQCDTPFQADAEGFAMCEDCFAWNMQKDD